MNIEVRPAQKDDLPILNLFEQGIIDAERPLDPDVRQDEIHYYNVAELMDRDDVHLVVAEVDGNIVSTGYAEIKKSKAWHTHDRHCYLGFMYTLPEFRGKGMNKLVLDELENWTKGHGIHDMILEVYHNNPAAVRAYEKAGFDPRLLEMRKRII